MNNWEISLNQKKLLDSLFSGVDLSKVTRVLDIGSGRTSIFYLAGKFKNVKIKGIVYPDDQRKIQPIKECVKLGNYELVEVDLKDFHFSQEFDVALAHLFLGEAGKFAGNNFEEILNKLFNVKTKYLILVNLFRDNIDYNLLLKKITEKGDLIKVAYTKSDTDSGDECIGLTIKFI